MRSTISPPSTAATAVFLLGALAGAGVWLPPNAVCRRVEGSLAPGVGGGGGIVKSARSCTSVSRMSAVISCGWIRALVNILGCGNLESFTLASRKIVYSGQKIHTEVLQLKLHRARFAPDARQEATWLSLCYQFYTMWKRLKRLKQFAFGEIACCLFRRVVLPAMTAQGWLW